MSIIDELKKCLNSLSKKQKIIAKFVVDNVQDLSFLTAKQVARATGVSEATVTRFVYALGYDNFAQFQQGVRDYNHDKVSSHLCFLDDQNKQDEQGYRAVFNLEMSLMEEALGLIDESSFAASVERLVSADEVWIVACSPHDFLANFIATYMGLYLDHLHVLNNAAFSLVTCADRFGPRSASLVFSFPRYPKETQRIVEIMDKRGVYNIGITDSLLSPIVPFMDSFFLIPHKYLILMDPFAGVFALIHSLIMGIYRHDPQKFKKKLRRYEAFSREADLFVSGNLNLAEMF